MTTDADGPHRSTLRLSKGEFWSGDLGLTLITISVATLCFIVTPLREAGLSVRVVLDLIVVTLMVSGAIVAKTSRVFRVCVIAVALATALVLAAARLHPTAGLHILGSLLSTITLFLYVPIVLLVMFRAGPVTWSRIQGGISAYLLLGMTWASAFEFLEQLHPGSFHFVSAPADLDQLTSKLTYFSFATLTTVGSDISPVLPFARSLTTAEAVAGQLFPPILIGALVAIAVQSRPKS